MCNIADVLSVGDWYDFIANIKVSHYLEVQYFLEWFRVPVSCSFVIELAK